MSPSLGRHSYLLLGWFIGNNPSVHRIVRLPSLLLWYQGLLSYCMHAYSLTCFTPAAPLPPSLLSPKSFRKVRRLLASFAPQENTEKRAQTVKMTKQCLGWGFIHTFHENDFGLTLMAKMIFTTLNCREKGFDLRQMIMSLQKLLHISNCVFFRPKFSFFNSLLLLDLTTSIRERPLMTSDIRVGRGWSKIAPQIGRYRVGQGR